MYSILKIKIKLIDNKKSRQTLATCQIVMYTLPNFREKVVFLSERLSKNPNLTIEDIMRATKLRKFRDFIKIGQEIMSVRLDVTIGTVAGYETLLNPVSKNVYKKFKTFKEVQGIPFNFKEIDEYKKEAYQIQEEMNYSKKEDVRAEIKRLENCITWCFDDGLINYCNIFIGIYRYMLGEKKECDDIISNLNKEVFGDEHYHWYYRLTGMIAHDKRHYIETIKTYHDADALSTKLGIDNKKLTYKLGYAYTETGYPVQGQEYLNRLKPKEIRFIFYRDSFPYYKFSAINYAKTSTSDEALKLLNSYEKSLNDEDKDNKPLLINLNNAFGQVYYYLDNDEKALHHYNLALDLHEHKDEWFLATMCYKLMVQRRFKVKDISLDELKETIEIAEKDSFWYDWLNAIYHSLHLHDKESIKYLTKISIPKMTTIYGRPEIIIEIRKWLADFYVPNSYKEATKQYKEIDKLRVKILKGELLS